MKDIELARISQEVTERFYNLLAACLKWIKMQRTYIEHVLSAYHPIATTERTSRIDSFVPVAVIATIRRTEVTEYRIGVTVIAA